MEPLVGQIEIFAFEFAPSGWMVCNGQRLSIQQFPTLYQLIGTTYGGDGPNTFALPKLAPIAPQGPSYFITIEGNFPSNSGRPARDDCVPRARAAGAAGLTRLPPSRGLMPY